MKQLLPAVSLNFSAKSVKKTATDFCKFAQQLGADNLPSLGLIQRLTHVISRICKTSHIDKTFGTSQTFDLGDFQERQETWFELQQLIRIWILNTLGSHPLKNTEILYKKLS